jgi:hypothetical protein
MKPIRIRPPKDGARKITILQKRIAAVAQLRLAHIQQIQSDIADLHRQLSREWKQLRKEIAAGATIQSGPLRAFIRKKGRRKYLVIQ